VPEGQHIAIRSKVLQRVEVGRGVRSRIEHEGIRAGAAVQDIFAVAANQPVFADAALQRIDIKPAVQRIIAVHHGQQAVVKIDRQPRNRRQALIVQHFGFDQHLAAPALATAGLNSCAFMVAAGRPVRGSTTLPSIHLATKPQPVRLVTTYWD
jgi:hypothetical protein